MLQVLELLELLWRHVNMVKTKGIFGYGYTAPTNFSLTNLVSNTGVVGADVTGVGTGRREPGACSFN